MHGKGLSILVVAAHPDDAEIGMGGTIARLAQQGHEVLICDMTDGSPTPRGDRASRLVEAREALAALQPTMTGPVGPVGPARPIRRILLNLPNRTLEHSIATRHALAGVMRMCRAQVVFVPHWEDAHPDHIAATRIAEDARFDAKLTRVDMPVPPLVPEWADLAPEALREGRDGGGGVVVGVVSREPIYPQWMFYYDISHLRRAIVPSFCMDITGFESAKQRSVRAYRSQFGPWDNVDGGASGGGAGAGGFAPGDPKASAAWTGAADTGAAESNAGSPSAPKPHPGALVASDFPDRLLSYAAYFGGRIGTRFAEPFVTREPLGLMGLDGLTGLS